MHAVPRSTVAIISEFLQKNLLNEGYEYSWKVTQKCWDKLDVGFNVGPSSDPKDVNKALKHYLSARWEEADRNEKVKLATWVIRDWGGIKGNKLQTIESYVDLADQTKPETPLKGVASYSKVLAIKDPERYAIYDARVAAALNAIQLLCNSSPSHFDKFFFPYLPGRNSVIEGSKQRPGFVKIANKKRLTSSEFEFQVMKSADAYAVYLDLLHSIAGVLGSVDIVDIEMFLFSKATDLCTDARGQSL